MGNSMCLSRGHVKGEQGKGSSQASGFGVILADRFFDRAV